MMLTKSNIIKFFSFILLTLAFSQFFAVDIGLASNCPASYECMPGSTTLPGGYYSGGSSVYGEIRADLHGDYIYPKMRVFVGKLRGTRYNLGCYVDSKGDGYLIRSISPMTFSARGHQFSVRATKPSGSFYLPTRAPLQQWVEFERVKKTKLKPGVTYTLSSGWFRRHICSTYNTDDANKVKKITIPYIRPFEWSVDGVSYVGNNGRNKQGNANNRKKYLFRIRPSQTVYWDHDLYNRGPDYMNKNVDVNIDHRSRSLETGRQLSFKSTGAGRHRGKAGQKFYSNHNNQTIKQDDVGKEICQRIAWKPKSAAVGDWGVSEYACIEVPYYYTNCDPLKEKCDTPPPDYDCNYHGNCPGGGPNGRYINPKTSHTGPSTVFYGDTVSFDYSVTHKSGPTKTKPMNAKAYTFILKGGENVRDIDKTKVYPMNNFTNVDCNGSGSQRSLGDKNITDGNNARCYNNLGKGNIVVYPGKTNNIGGYNASLKEGQSWYNAEPGDKICSYVALDNWAVWNGQVYNSVIASNIDCVDVAKKPQDHVRGGDSKADEGFKGSGYNNVSLNVNRGSYSQYGLISYNGNINYYGSAGHTNVIDDNKKLACRLDFANVKASVGAISSKSIPTVCSTNIGDLGKFNGQSDSHKNHKVSVPTIGANVKVMKGSYLDLSTIKESGVYTYDPSDLTANTLTVSGSLNKGVHATIYVGNKKTSSAQPNTSDTRKGHIVIDNNIENSQNLFDTLVDIPSLNLYATGDITVNSNVTNIDANLIAESIKTCDITNTDGGSIRNRDLGLNPNAKCRNQLNINGSLVTTNKDINFSRTFGGGKYEGTGDIEDLFQDNNRKAPSEIINYGPASYLAPFAAMHPYDDTTNWKTSTLKSMLVRY